MGIRQYEDLFYPFTSPLYNCRGNMQIQGKASGKSILQGYMGVENCGQPLYPHDYRWINADTCYSQTHARCLHLFYARIWATYKLLPSSQAYMPTLPLFLCKSLKSVWYISCGNFCRKFWRLKNLLFKRKE